MIEYRKNIRETHDKCCHRYGRSGLMALPAEKERYTYADYLSWDNDVEQFEIIDGEAILMAPGASNSHQGISVSIASQLYAYLKGKSCVVRTAPFDVRLFEREEDSPEDVNTVVQPDIMVIVIRVRLMSVDVKVHLIW